MKPAERSEAIELLKAKFGHYNIFYITNTEPLSVAQVTDIRIACCARDVEIRVANKPVIRRALESLNNQLYPERYDSLKGVTALMFSDSAKEPAVILSDFRKKNPGDKPFLKAALIGEEVFIGDENLNTLKNIKSKEELIGEVITLLQSPISRVVSALTQKAEKDAEGGEEVAEETSEE